MIKKGMLVLFSIVVLMLVASIGTLASDSGLPKTSDEFFGEESFVGMGWGGVGIGAWYPNLDGLNEALGIAGVKLDEPIMIITGSGEGGIVPGFSIGGFGGGNYITEGNVQMEVGLGGFTFNRTFPLKDGHWYFGGILGGGGAQMIINNANLEADTVDEAVTEPQQSVLQTAFFAIGPQAGLQLPITPFIQLRASAGYVFAIGTDWELLGSGKNLSGGDVNWSGPMAQIGIVFGGSVPVNPPVFTEEALSL